MPRKPSVQGSSFLRENTKCHKLRTGVNTKTVKIVCRELQNLYVWFGLERDCSLEGHAQWKKEKPTPLPPGGVCERAVCPGLIHHLRLVSAQAEHTAEQHLALEQ